MMRCPSCGSLLPRPAPEPGSGYGDYYTLRPPRAVWRAWARALADLTRRAYIERAIPADAGPVLDFGCGSGDFLGRISGSGRACFGTDLTRPPESSGAWTWLEADRLEDSGPFDWITLGHVLEHLSDPAGVVVRLARVLSPGGGLWIATPNADSFLFSSAGRWARDVDYPRHQTIYSAAGLRQLLTTAGLHATFVSPPRLNAVLNVLATARNIVRDRPSPLRARAAALARTLASLGAHLLQPRSRRDRESPELVAICRIRPPARSPVL
jgi:SAM-dependent methyltransferase